MDTNVENNENVAVLSPEQITIDLVGEVVLSLFMEVRPIITSESWGGWVDADKRAFREALDELDDLMLVIRNGFDQPVWNGRIQGVEPIRQKSSRRAETTEPLTPEQELEAFRAKRAAKKG